MMAGTPGARLLRGVPGALGVVLGIILYGQEPDGAKWFILVVVLATALVLCAISWGVVTRAPRLALALTELWIISGLAIGALFTQAVLWLTVSAGLFDLSGDELNAVKGALVGALTTYFASAWLMEINDSKGLFVPGGLYSLLLSRFARHHKSSLKWNEQVRAACVSEIVANTSIRGWGICSRWARAHVCAGFL